MCKALQILGVVSTHGPVGILRGEGRGGESRRRGRGTVSRGLRISRCRVFSSFFFCVFCAPAGGLELVVCFIFFIFFPSSRALYMRRQKNDFRAVLCEKAACVLGDFGASRPRLVVYRMLSCFSPSVRSPLCCVLSASPFCQGVPMCSVCIVIKFRKFPIVGRVVEKKKKSPC